MGFVFALCYSAIANTQYFSLKLIKHKNVNHCSIENFNFNN